MLKPINASWKIPIGSFPFKTLTGVEKKIDHQSFGFVRLI